MVGPLVTQPCQWDSEACQERGQYPHFPRGAAEMATPSVPVVVPRFPALRGAGSRGPRACPRCWAVHLRNLLSSPRREPHRTTGPGQQSTAMTRGCPAQLWGPCSLYAALRGPLLSQPRWELGSERSMWPEARVFQAGAEGAGWPEAEEAGWPEATRALALGLRVLSVCGGEPGPLLLRLPEVLRA